MSLPNSGWRPIPCWVADRLRPGMTVLSSLSDLGGEYGEPQVYTEWGTEDGRPLMREWRYPSGYFDGSDRRPCEHLVAPTTLLKTVV